MSEWGVHRRAVISELLAQKYWAGEDPIGKSIRVRGESIEIIGASGDARGVLLRAPAPILYRPWRDEPDHAQQVDIRTSDDPLGMAQAVKGVVRDMGGVVAEVYRGRQIIEDAWGLGRGLGLLVVPNILGIMLA